MSYLGIRFFFRQELREDQQIEKPSSVEELMERDEEAIIIKNKDTLRKGLLVLVGVIVLFSLQGLTHIEVSIVAIGGGSWSTCYNTDPCGQNTSRSGL